MKSGMGVFHKHGRKRSTKCEESIQRIKEAVEGRYEGFPEITISAFDEVGEAPIEIPRQRMYSGRRPVISSALANTPCATLGVDGLLDNINAILETSYTLDTSFLSSFLQICASTVGISYKPDNMSLYSVLKFCVCEDYDFGTAYARLRMIRYGFSIAIKEELQDREAQDRQMRQKALVQTRIIDLTLPPRRVWDLYSNRVVPYWITNGSPWAISHAWMNEKDRVDVWTPINGYEWPVPIPKDSNLDLIRIEMLNLGAEYIWLDVLCLRQTGGTREDLRAEEWKLDVPTIGSIYSQAETVVCYFSGLGRPFHLVEADLYGDRCWFKRAWTLQEITRNWILGGDTANANNSVEEIRVRYRQQLAALELTRWSANRMFEVLSLMQNRVSTKPVDRVAGLVYLLRSTAIPAYCETQSEEDAWKALVDTMERTHRGQLFFFYPEPGNSNKRWRPSWDQLMNKILPSTDGDQFAEDIGRDEDADADWYDGPCIEEAFVQGFSTGHPEGKLRWGELIVDGTGTSHVFKTVAVHQYLIPDNSYTLLGSRGSWRETGQYWVVGRRRKGYFEKVSVLRMTDSQERERLDHLGVARGRARFILV